MQKKNCCMKIQQKIWRFAVKGEYNYTLNPLIIKFYVSSFYSVDLRKQVQKW